MDKRKKKLLTIGFVILNIAVIAYTAISEFGKGNDGVVPPHFTGASILYLLGAVLCLVVLYAAESTKYVLMMRSLGEKVSWRAAFETAAIGKYYDCITPSGAGGQPFQIYWLHSHGYSDGAASAMTIVGFIMMQSGYVLIAIITFIFWHSEELAALRVTANIGIVAYGLVPSLLVASYYRPDAVLKLVSGAIRLGAKLHIVKKPEESIASVKAKLDEFHESYKQLAGKKVTLVLLQALSVIFSVALCSLPWFVLMAMGGSVDYINILATTIFIYAAVTVVPTPGNAGAAEGAFYTVFSSMKSAGVFWAMLIWRLLSYYAFIAVGGTVYGINALQARRKGTATGAQSKN